MAFPAKKKSAGSAPAKKTASNRPTLTAKQKKKLVEFKAPSDMKSAYYELKFVVQHDGLISPNINVERIKGSWDNPEAKRFNLATYDVATLVGIASRLQAAGYSSNFFRRWPAGAKLGMFIRASVSKATGLITVSVKAGYQMVEGSSGKLKKQWFTIEKEPKKVDGKTVRNEDGSKKMISVIDPTYKKMRRAARLLRGAFVANQLPPSTGRRKKADIDEGDE